MRRSFASVTLCLLSLLACANQAEPHAIQTLTSLDVTSVEIKAAKGPLGALIVAGSQMIRSDLLANDRSSAVLLLTHINRGKDPDGQVQSLIQVTGLEDGQALEVELLKEFQSAGETSDIHLYACAQLFALAQDSNHLVSLPDSALSLDFRVPGGQAGKLLSTQVVGGTTYVRTRSGGSIDAESVFAWTPITIQPAEEGEFSVVWGESISCRTTSEWSVPRLSSDPGGLYCTMLGDYAASGCTARILKLNEQRQFEELMKLPIGFGGKAAKFGYTKDQKYPYWLKYQDFGYSHGNLDFLGSDYIFSIDEDSGTVLGVAQLVNESASRSQAHCHQLSGGVLVLTKLPGVAGAAANRQITATYVLQRAGPGRAD